MSDDLVATLTRFHREVVLPEMKEFVHATAGELRDELNGHFDAIYQRFDRLETKYHSICSVSKRAWSTSNSGSSASRRA